MSKYQCALYTLLILSLVVVCGCTKKSNLGGSQNSLRPPSESPLTNLDEDNYESGYSPSSQDVRESPAEEEVVQPEESTEESIEEFIEEDDSEPSDNENEEDEDSYEDEYEYEDDA